MYFARRAQLALGRQLLAAGAADAMACDAAGFSNTALRCGRVRRCLVFAVNATVECVGVDISWGAGLNSSLWACVSPGVVLWTHVIPSGPENVKRHIVRVCVDIVSLC